MNNQTKTQETGLALLSIPEGKEIQTLRENLFSGMEETVIASVEQIASALLSVGAVKTLEDARGLVPQLDGEEFIFSYAAQHMGGIPNKIGFTKRPDGNYNIATTGPSYKDIHG